MKKPVFIVAAVALPILIGGALFFAKEHLPSRVQAMLHVARANPAAKNPGSVRAEKRSDAMVDVEPFAVNLAGPGFSHYLRISFRLSLREEEDKERIKGAAAEIRDVLLLLLTSKTAEQLLSADGKTLLRKEIAERVNSAAGRPMVMAVYFKDFLIQ